MPKDKVRFAYVTSIALLRDKNAWANASGGDIERKAD